VAVTSTGATLVIQSEEGTSAAVTARLGLQPTRSFERGERHPRVELKRQHSGWALQSPLPDDGDDLERHLRYLVDLLAPKREELRALAADGYTLKWWCFVSEEDGQGGVSIGRELLRDLASLDVDILFDIYASSESER
jgi:hypothetical protein